MTYLVLARKYRPERFSEMVGQEHVTRTLANAIATGRVHHAYLFCGVRGLGKTSAARILARGLVCEKGPSPDPCNACEQCKAVIEGRSVDVREIDGASNNSVEDIRTLREQVHYLPQSARRKIYIIDEVHMLTASAFNALLKTLEEPPPHVTFIFATTDPHKVLGTILSRVSRLDFRRVHASALVVHLQNILAKEGCFVDPEGLHTIAICGDGSVRDALTLLDKVIAFAQDPKHVRVEEVQEILGQSDKNAIFSLVDAILAHDSAQALATLDTILASTSDIAHFAMAFLQHLRDLTVAKVSGHGQALIDAGPARLERLLAQAAKVDTTHLGQLFDRFTRALERIDRSRAPRLTLEMAIVDLAHADALMPLGAVVDKLRELARGGASPGPTSSSGPSGQRPSNPRTPPVPAVPSNQGSGVASHAPPVNAALVDDLWKMVQGTNKGASSTPASHPPNPPSTRPPQGEHEVPRPFVQAGSRPERGNDESAGPAKVEPSSVALAELPSADLVSASPILASPALASVAMASSSPLEQTPPMAPVAPAPAASRSFEPLPLVEAWQPSPDYLRWEAFLHKVRQSGNEWLSATLAEFGVVRCNRQGIEWVAPKDNFASEHLARGPELREALDRALVEYFGQGTAITRRIGQPSLESAPSFTLVERHRAHEHRAKTELAALNHPSMQQLLTHFAGKVRSITVLSEPPPWPEAIREQASLPSPSPSLEKPLVSPQPQQIEPASAAARESAELSLTQRPHANTADLGGTWG